MFLYWEGYEIDGSDTDFDIVLPEIKQFCDFIECFLSIPIFGNSVPEFYRESTTPKYQQISLTKEEYMELLMQPDREELYISMNCVGMDELSEELRQQLYALSEKREPQEDAYGKVIHPCMAPRKQIHHTRGEMTITLCAQTRESSQGWYTNDEESLDGVIYNKTLLLAERENPVFTINVGPSFYYEYAMFVIEWLRDSFPSIGITGGLDCAGGWTEGCTYADSIYRYEKVQIPVKNNIADTIKNLWEGKMLRSYQVEYRTKWHYEILTGFRMVNIPKEKFGSPYILSYEDYIKHVENMLNEHKEHVYSMYETAVHILLPKPAEFTDDPNVKERLEHSLGEVAKLDQNWQYQSYAAFLLVEGKPMCEFRVPWNVRKYFLMLLEEMELGE